jgi:hypothetical protein
VREEGAVRVFTLPHELSALALPNKRALYQLLFRTCSENVARDMVEQVLSPGVKNAEERGAASAGARVASRLVPYPARGWPTYSPLRVSA